MIDRNSVHEELKPLIKQDVFKVVKHATHIKPDDMNGWIDAAIRRNASFVKLEALTNPLHSQHIPESDMVSHIREHISGFLLPRLNYVTGTDAAKVTTHRTGIASSFGGDAVTVAREKLMQIPPLYPDAHLLRGQSMEYKVEDWAIENGYNPRKDLLQAIKDNQQGHPYLRGTPDAVLEKVLESTSRIVLGDYKLPNKRSSAVQHDYTMQLHHYGLCSMIGNSLNPDNPVNLDDMMILEGSMSDYRIVEKPVPWDESLAIGILEEGAMVYESYSKGLMPDIEVKKSYVDFGADSHSARLMRELSQVRTMKELIDSEELRKQDELKAYLGSNLDRRNVVINHHAIRVAVGQKPSFTPESLDALVSEYRVETEGKTPSAIEKALIKAVEDQGQNIGDIVPHESTYRISASRKKDDLKLRDQMTEKYKGLADLVTQPDLANQLVSMIHENPLERRVTMEEEIEAISSSLQVANHAPPQKRPNQEKEVSQVVTPQRGGEVNLANKPPSQAAPQSTGQPPEQDQFKQRRSVPSGMKM